MGLNLLKNKVTRPQIEKIVAHLMGAIDEKKGKRQMGNWAELKNK